VPAYQITGQNRSDLDPNAGAIYGERLMACDDAQRTNLVSHQRHRFNISVKRSEPGPAGKCGQLRSPARAKFSDVYTCEPRPATLLTVTAESKREHAIRGIAERAQLQLLTIVQGRLEALRTRDPIVGNSRIPRIQQNRRTRRLINAAPGHDNREPRKTVGGNGGSTQNGSSLILI